MTSDVISVVTIVIISGVLLYLLIDPRHKKGGWKELAASMGMHYEDQDLPKGILSAEVRGEYRGRSLILNTIRSGTELRTLYTQIQVPVANPKGHSLSLTRRNIFTEIVRRLGVPYTPTGDNDFDRQFVVLTKPSLDTNDFLGSSYLRKKLLRAPKLDVRLKGSKLNFRVRGFVNDHETLRELFDLITDVAESVDQDKQPELPFSSN